MKVFNRPGKAEWKQLCRRPVLVQAELDDIIGTIFAEVANEGDKSLIAYTERFDRVLLEQVMYPLATVAKQASRVPIALRKAIDVAARNIETFHLAFGPPDLIRPVETMPGVVCWQESRPIDRVGLYVPGGNAPLVSTVLMLGVPAQVAGCREIVLCTPPQKDGNINPAICYAALKVGITRLIRVGGAQAIAALAIGTESVPKVDKLFGPGNQYVMAAKQAAVGYGVAIDIPAGPSEVMVVADTTAKPAFVAADLLSQAEHGPDSQVVLVGTDKRFIASTLTEIDRQLARLPRRNIAEAALKQSFCAIMAGLDQAIEFANYYAPEHLILATANSKKLARQVTNAGSVFLGNYSPESAGDYASGTNHTLPTNGWARSHGGVSLASFVKQVSFQAITKDGLQLLAPTVKTLAKAEGLEAHSRAVSIRLLEK